MPDIREYERVTGVAESLLAEGTVPTAAMVAERAGMSLSTYYRLVQSHGDVLRDAGHIEEPSSREKLLEAAAELTAEVGITNLVMDEVAVRAGVSRGTLYRTFPGKDRLLGELAREHSPLGALGALLKGVADRDPADVLPGIVAVTTPRLVSNRGVLRAVLAQAAVDEPQEDEAREVIRTLYSELAEYFQGQMAAGALRKMDPLAAVHSFLGPLLLYSVVRPDMWPTDSEQIEPHQLTQQLVQTWLRGMRP